MILITSCKKKLDEVSDNPNNPNSITPGVLLTAAESDLAYIEGGDLARFASIFTQHIDGNNRQFLTYQLYVIGAQDVNTVWANTFGGCFNNLVKMKKQCDQNHNNYYGAIARCLLAYEMVQTTDMWNAMPYSEAFQGFDNLSPKYDSQKSIYDSAFLYLNQAVVLLAGSDATYKLPYDNDLFYGGNKDAWTNFAHALKARMYLHLSKADVSNYSNALAEVNASNFSSGADDARFPFANTSTGAAPMFQYLDSRGDFGPGATMLTLLTTLNDPRIAPYDFYNDPNGYGMFVPDQKLSILSNAEMQFIKAECLLKTGASDADVRAAYLAAISQSFSDLGLSADYVNYTAQSSVTPSTITLNEIITQKYIAMYCDPEVFSDWRRTSIPLLTPNAGTQIPRRLPYSQDEIDLNSNTPKGLTLFNRVDWDK